MPFGPARMIVLTHRAGDQDMAQEHQHIAQGHGEAEHQRDEDGQDHQAQAPVALGHRFEQRDEIEDRQRKHPEGRREEDQQPEAGAVRERIRQAFAQARHAPVDAASGARHRTVSRSAETSADLRMASGSYHRFGLAMISSTRVLEARRPWHPSSAGTTSRDGLARFHPYDSPPRRRGELGDRAVGR